MVLSKIGKVLDEALLTGRLTALKCDEGEVRRIW